MQATAEKSLILEIQDVVVNVVELAIKCARKEDDQYRKVQDLIREAFIALTDAREEATKIDAEKLQPRP